MNQGTNLGSQIGRWIVLAALVALLGALLLTIRPVGAQDAPPSVSNVETQFTYDEKGTGPITTYRARDPEGRPIFWTLGGPDAADFTIADGTLRFRSLPNFEVPTDRANDEDGSGGDLSPDDEGAANNVYKITVRIGAGGEDGAPGTDDYAGDDLQEIDLTIIVGNVNEDGRVVISPMQPQVGTELTAILTDEDNVRPGVGVWQWARSDSMTGPWEDIPLLSDEMNYSPTIDDLDKYLRVQVRYVDRAGSESRNVEAVSAYKVRQDTNTSNDRPKYPDQSTLTGATLTTTPLNSRQATDRFIPETAGAGTNVGAPVTAFDDDTDIEVLTYSLRDPLGTTGPNVDGVDNDSDPDTLSESDGHARRFNIDEKTGQITVSTSAMLDADADPDATNPNPYTVVVRAVDGDGDDQNITVTIHVLEYEEPPIIDRVYVADADPTPNRLPEDSIAGNRVPTEMSHYELDRTNTPATAIDTNLDTENILSSGTDPNENAVYTAWDPDGDTIKWSLDGDDAGSFNIPPDTNNARIATLVFDSGPDFEAKSDKNEDNVYEVTIVVTDGTYDMEGKLRKDELNVTVKVINSTDDNTPGTVSFSNRQPEVATALTAAHVDTDGDISQLKWQWYRSSENTITGVCEKRIPDNTVPVAGLDGVDDRRYFVENDADTIAIETDGWRLINTDDARTARYTPKAPIVLNNDRTVNTDATAAATDVGRCLRATVTYRDGVDRTHSDANVQGTDVDETLEATWAATERPVKVEDKRNKAPVFRTGTAYSDAPQSTYRKDIEENSGDTEIDTFVAAVDVFTFDDNNVEDDTANDLLTYEILDELDGDSFTITGTIEDITPTDVEDDGDLTFTGGGNFEGKKEYRVKVKATDPSGDSDTATVIINITPLNEGPYWVMTSDEEVYAENGTTDVFKYKAADPERSGITYSLVMEAVEDPDGDAATEDGIATTDVVDHIRFEIHSLDGNLSFKASPNFEDPKDGLAANEQCPETPPAGTCDNRYKVTVKAESEDDETPRHATYQKLTVIVTNVHEKPVFSETTDALTITENPDDPEKEPPSTARDEYLLNRGVGIPSPANPPAAPNLDVGIPVIAADDDNTFTATNYTSFTERNNDAAYSATNRPVQLIDGLTYELSGDDDPFVIVPATGQILTTKKLDYETQKEYKVKVKAIDPWGLYGMIDLTISVTDVNEAPVPDILMITGDELLTYEENDTVALGDYTVAAGGDATPGGWTLEGDDASSFMLEGSGTTRMLKFRSAPDYENPRGAAMSDTNTNTYEVTLKVTDRTNSDISDIHEVTITVTDVEELGALSGSKTASVNEGSTDSLNTYTLTAIEDGPKVTWSVEGTDMSDFMLEGTGMSRMLKFSSAPDYETPMGGADNDSNTYMVTVMAKAGGQMAMVEVTVMVDDVNELGTLSGPGSASTMEGMDAVGTYMASGTMADTATWTLDGDDASHFMLDMVEGSDMSRMLKFSSAPDYEMPRGMAMSDDNSNTYMVTVMAEAGGEMDMVEVTVEVTNVDELGTLSGSTTASINEGATDALGTYTLTGTAADTADWSLDETGTSDFMLEGTGMSRMLKFESAPDYENPMGGADDDSNTYMVTVKAEAGGEMEMMEVTITVTNEEEAGTVTLDPARPSVGTAITATLADDDIVKENTVSWSWASAGAMDGDFEDITGADSATYTPVDDDADMYLQATATYDDGYDTDNVEMKVTDSDVSQLAVNGPAEVEHTENVTTVATYMASGADSVQWSLTGDDAGDFNISGGQLTFGTSPDYEDPADADTDNVYMVTVVATASDLTDDQDVTVTVSNVDELGTLAGDGSLTYAEGGTAAVGTYMVSGGDGSTTINWSLDGADASQFMLDGTGMSRMLNFRSAPDYESPMGGADDDSNTYMVTVKAEAGGEMAMQEVTVEVTNMEEDGTVTLDPARPSVGSEVTATLTDLDGGITGTTWQWSKSMTMDGTFTDIDMATSASYTTVEGDAGMYLQATATYTDGHDTGKMATSEAVMIRVDMVSGYDTNDDGDISIAELFVAIDDYFDGGISIAELFEVIDAYFG